MATVKASEFMESVTHLSIVWEYFLRLTCTFMNKGHVKVKVMVSNEEVYWKEDIVHNKDF